MHNSLLHKVLLSVKQESMILNSILISEKLRSNFPSIHSYTVCAISRLVLSVTSSVGIQ